MKKTDFKTEAAGRENFIPQNNMTAFFQVVRTFNV